MIRFAHPGSALPRTLASLAGALICAAIVLGAALPIGVMA